MLAHVVHVTHVLHVIGNINLGKLWYPVDVSLLW